ncbi:MAG: hypothetical protein HGA33_00580 [Candidatus Moranbacteria bacterium]|nr:hypothetical protein [Candidatus Moranbacteria bacterium]
MATLRKKANPNNSSEMTLYSATRQLITLTGATEVGFNPWSLPLFENGPVIARIRFNKAYVFETKSHEWIILPGTIENDPKKRFTRGLFLIPNVNEYSGPTRDFFNAFFTDDVYDRAIRCVAMGNGAFMTNDDAPHMGRFAAMLSEVTPVTGEDTATGIEPDEAIFSSHPTGRSFSTSGEIQYKKAYAKKLAETFQKIVSRYR